MWFPNSWQKVLENVTCGWGNLSWKYWIYHLWPSATCDKFNIYTCDYLNHLWYFPILFTSYMGISQWITLKNIGNPRIIGPIIEKSKAMLLIDGLSKNLMDKVLWILMNLTTAIHVIDQFVPIWVIITIPYKNPFSWWVQYWNP